jgi:hypothetical protein
MPHFTEVPASSQESICVRSIDFASFWDFGILFWYYYDIVVFFLFHCIHKEESLDPWLNPVNVYSKCIYEASEPFDFEFNPC